MNLTKGRFNLLNIFNASFTGEDEFPVLLKQPEDFRIPFQLTRFTDRKQASLNDAICFYEWDQMFTKQLSDARIKRIIPDLRLAGSVIQPDYSIYADEPLLLQKMAVFERNRVAVELQNAGIPIIPNLRWGDERSYEFAFAGIPKHQVCAIGTHGQIRDLEKRELLKNGLGVALEAVEPRMVLVYGQMPDDIFGQYLSTIDFKRYPSWQESFAIKEGA